MRKNRREQHAMDDGDDNDEYDEDDDYGGDGVGDNNNDKL